jgi:molecular chaperone GrpE
MADENIDVDDALEDKLSELEILKQSLDEIKAKEAAQEDKFLRLNAEFHTFRLRTEKRLAEARQYGKEEALMQILSLNDTLQQAEQSSRQSSDIETIKKGITMLKDQVDKFLKEQGLVPIKTKGEKLDPHRHEAIARVETTEFEDGTVIDEVQRGYTWQDRVVRPSRVRVAVAPKESAQTQEENNHV